MSKIRGQVAELIDDRTLVINKGAKDGVSEDMIFVVFDELGKPVKDPVTGEDLGTITLPKIEVKVTVVEERYSIAETFKYKEVNIGGTNRLLGVADIFDPPKYVKRPETFRIDETTRKKIDKDKSFVSIGDIVEQK